jgi:hypothetical protein
LKPAKTQWCFNPERRGVATSRSGSFTIVGLEAQLKKRCEEEVNVCG